MIAAFPLALAQLADPRILRILLLSLAITLGLFGLAGWGLWTLVDGLDPCSLLISGYDCTIGGEVGRIATLLMVLILLWFLFPAIAIGVIGLFADGVVAAVEARHYPDAAKVARSPGVGETVSLALGSVGRLLGYNLLASPAYLALLFTAVGPMILFLFVNALALGRDLGEMVAARHLDGAGRREWLGRTRPTRALLGLVATGLFMVPVANLFAPILGAAIATHVFHRSRP